MFSVVAGEIEATRHSLFLKDGAVRKGFDVDMAVMSPAGQGTFRVMLVSAVSRTLETLYVTVLFEPVASAALMVGAHCQPR